MLRRLLFPNAPLRLQLFWRGFSNWRKDLPWHDDCHCFSTSELANPLETFFDNRKEGRGIWKWRHYFDIYERHFSRFRGHEARILEIGIYSGGSLEMWRDYFGPRSYIYGVDIRPECKRYETESIKISIGDQADRNFWKEFKAGSPALDVVIDDGGHGAEQQIVAFEELFPFLRPGGVYLCEDLHGVFNGFAMYVQGLAHNLNEAARLTSNLNDKESRLTCETSGFQRSVRSVHLYPFVAVIERADSPVTELVAPMHGTQWQPFPA
jgi:hypothetical protein